MIYERNKVTFNDLIALYDNLIWLEVKSQTDEDFQRKFGRFLEILAKILKEINISQGLSPRALTRLTMRIQKDLEGFFVPHRNYPGFKKRFSGSFAIRELSTSTEANRHLPPKRIMGIGYRDKGTARNPAFDGSPSWQEVASRDGQIAMAIEGVRHAKNIKQVERIFKDLYGDNS